MNGQGAGQPNMLGMRAQGTAPPPLTSLDAINMQIVDSNRRLSSILDNIRQYLDNLSGPRNMQGGGVAPSNSTPPTSRLSILHESANSTDTLITMLNEQLDRLYSI